MMVANTSKLFFTYPVIKSAEMFTNDLYCCS